MSSLSVQCLLYQRHHRPPPSPRQEVGYLLLWMSKRQPMVYHMVNQSGLDLIYNGVHPTFPNYIHVTLAFWMWERGSDVWWHQLSCDSAASWTCCCCEEDFHKGGCHVSSIISPLNYHSKIMGSGLPFKMEDQNNFQGERGSRNS